MLTLFRNTNKVETKTINQNKTIPINTIKTNIRDTGSKKATNTSLLFNWPDTMDIILFLAVISSLVLWFFSLKPVSLNTMSDLGLVSALSPATIVAPGILVVSFALTLQRRKVRAFLLTLHLAAMCPDLLSC